MSSSKITSTLGHKLYYEQRMFAYNMMPFVCFIGGLGSGKTYAGIIKAILLSLLHRGGGGIIVSPTYSMLKSTILITLESILIDMGIDHLVKRRMQDMVVIFPWGSYIYLRSADNPSRLRGPNLCWGIIDEATIIRDFKKTFTSVASRMRDAKYVYRVDGKPYFQTAVTGSPEGALDEVYDTFFRAPEKPEDLARWLAMNYGINASSYNNPGLDKEYLMALEMATPEHLRPCLIGGQWLEMSRGVCYHNFSKDRHVTTAAKYNPKIPLRLSWDFNLTPMTCLVCQIPKIKGKKHLVILDEFSFPDSNTAEVCRAVIEKYGLNGLKHRLPIFIYGDSSGGKGTAEKTDYETILDYLGSHFQSEVNKKVPNHNPTHKERIQSCNAGFSNGQKQSHIIINPRCRILIRDLEFQKWDPRKPKSKDKRQTIGGQSIGHSSDAFDYIVYKEMKWRRPSRIMDPTLVDLTSSLWADMPDEPIKV